MAVFATPGSLLGSPVPRCHAPCGAMGRDLGRGVRAVSHSSATSASASLLGEGPRDDVIILDIYIYMGAVQKPQKGF